METRRVTRSDRENVMDTIPSCYERVALSRGQRESTHSLASTRLVIVQNCRAVCTKKRGPW
jgi:hypothetical protein